MWPLHNVKKETPHILCGVSFAENIPYKFIHVYNGDFEFVN